MAHHVEPMDVDSSVCDFDDKENSLHHSNVLARAPCTEKGYEELEVSELNMKLRYSVTPASSPMSKSFTANCLDNKQYEAGDNNISNPENASLTRSMNSTVTRSDSAKKVLPLQSLSTDQFTDGNRNALRPLDSTVTFDKNVTVTVSGPNDLDENLSIPSSSSSPAVTPEATTPTKEFHKQDGGSPIMRGLKSVLSMFRPSQSPIPTAENAIDGIPPEVLSPPVINSPNTSDSNTPSTMLVSTPLAAHKTALSKRETPNKETIVFNDDLENELEWKDDSTIIFSTEKVPLHKLFMSQTKPAVSMSSSNIINDVKQIEAEEKLDSTVEYMDVSYNDSLVKDKTITETEEANNKNDITNITESDSEFVDCETTFSKGENKNDISLDSKKDDEIKQDHNEDLNTTVTNESLNNTLSKTHDLTPLSTETTKASVNIENEVPSTVEEKDSQLNEEILDSNLIISTGKIAVTASKLVDEVSELSSNVECTDHHAFSCDIELDAVNLTYSNANKTGDVVQSIDVGRASVNNDNVSESIVVSSLSQIPLIADPRVLLFNIPEELPSQVMQNTKDLNTTPADIPLPDDEDLEKVNDIEETEKAECENIIEKMPVENANCELPEIVSQSEGMLKKHIAVKEDTDEQNEQVEPLQQKQATNENEMMSADIIPTNTDTVEILAIIDQVQFNECKEHNVVNDIASIHKVEFIPSHNVVIPEKTNEDISAIIIDKNVDEKHEHLTLNETTEMPTSASVTEPQRDGIEHATPDLPKSDFSEKVEISENIPVKVNTILDEQTNFNNQYLENEKEPSVEQIKSQTLTTIEEMDISYSTAVTVPNETENLAKAAGDKSIAGVDKNNINQVSIDKSLVEDIHAEVQSAGVDPILEKDMKEENILNDDSVISTVVGQEVVIEDKPTDLISEKSNEILSLTAVPTSQLEADNKERSLSEESKVAQTEETITNAESQFGKHSEEEIVASKDNSPFVSVSAYDLEINTKPEQSQNTFENLDNQIKTENDVSPPLSPKIVSRGYNLNFDEIDDPFATKSKIKLSPSPDGSPNESFENIEIHVNKPKTDFNKNRRRSQPARKKPAINKKMNSTFSGPSNTPKDHKEADQPNVVLDEIKTAPTGSFNDVEPPTSNNAREGNLPSEQLKISTECSINETQQEPQVPNEAKNTSSSEQSTYQSAEASSSEGRDYKSVFNLPEIDDPNLNPLLSKSKVCQSPVPFSQSDDPFATKSNLRSSPAPNENFEKVDNNDLKETIENKYPAQEEENLSNDASNTTCSSKATDEKDITIREVHTEDEDTIEGPFLEAEDIINDDKLSDFGGENIDMMEFSKLPTQMSENQESGEMFIDAEAFEFLLNQNKSNEVADSGKESLFLKFDPLYAKRMSSDGVVAALNRLQKKQSTPKKTEESLQNDITFDKSPVPGTSTMNVTLVTDTHNVTEDSIEDLNITVTKPMMVVNPAVNPVPAPRNKAITPVRSNRQSLTFTSPAIAVIDRLLSMSANNSLLGHEVSVTEVRGHSEADLALTQLRELLADKEISVYNLKSESKELKERLSTLESQMKKLESIGEERLKKINDLTEKLEEKTKMNKSMASVVEEYERTIASLIAETEQDRKRHAEERLQLIAERDEQTRHLASMEVSFSDLHSKYEKSKQMIFGFKANEDLLKKNVKDFEDNLAKMQTNYELLKQHATSKLNHANDELQKMNRAHETEVLKLNAMIKRQELHITSLEETLLQKSKANEELTAICDELINRVG